MTAKKFFFGLLGLSLVGVALLFFIQQEKERDGHWPWPLNGRVINQSPFKVKVWDDQNGFYTIAAGERSSNRKDVDHAQEPTSQRWCKIGARTLIVNPDGSFANCPCYALGAGRACIRF
ncbi:MULTISPECIES: hypothetical protein [Deefgea]|uniref:Uncharacterized protein n=1 Tax=Deefgea chitinilytica TaxID=570276 RepID=A0ABS2CF23_9NEIS|nr:MULTISPECIES: hypothetical protein [Deefgea]MBM5572667.1 hypothetical protein [Deefgea chitinilytica]MBM9889903.1 hypothetical protein [Deefgea sp. CFH1-16]